MNNKWRSPKWNNFGSDQRKVLRKILRIDIYLRRREIIAKFSQVLIVSCVRSLNYTNDHMYCSQQLGENTRP